MSEAESGREPIDEIRRELSKAAPPADLEDRVVRRLEREGLVRREGRSRARTWIGIAAALAVAAGLVGALLVWAPWTPGGAIDGAVPRTGDLYMLLLKEPDSGSLSPEETRALVDEYRDWARRQARQNVLVGGEKLDDRGLVLGPDRMEPREWEPGGDSLGGYLLVRAASYEDAAAIARTCPHLRHGGTIEIRKIEPT